MSKDISATLPSPVASVSAGPRLDARSSQARAELSTGGGSPGRSAVAEKEESVAPERILDQAVRKAAETMFADREVQVESFRDEGSGRLVYRIADRTSGEVIHQSPSDDLLRFFASGRSPGDGPIVHLEA